MKKNVSIVIIHYKTLEHLKQCLGRLHSEHSTTEIIVVDNASELSFTSLKRQFPEVSWIENARNRGFSFAANQGLQKASARWVLFLNPDILATTAEVEELYHYAEKKSLDAVSPHFTDERYRKPIPSLASLLAEFTPLHTLSAQVVRQKTLVGGCLLVRKKVLQQLCGWDERFFLWFEDSDLTARLLHNKYKVGFAPLVFGHIGGASVAQLPSQLQREFFFHSMDIYARKHFTRSQQLILRKVVIDRFRENQTYPTLNQDMSWVIPNMKLDLLEDFLRGNAHFFKESELIVVSSALNHKNIWKWRTQYPAIRFIPLSHNAGFSSTVNTGLRSATSAWIGTVNDDVILNDDSLPKLKKGFKREVGSINPVIYSLSEHIESAGIMVHKKGKAQAIETLPDSAITVVPATNGACVLYNKAALDEVGLFDEKFGSYLEDIDLSMRLHKAGFFNIVLKSSRVIHAKHGTSKSFGRYKRYLDLKNWWLMIVKHWSISDVVQHFPVIMVERVRNVSGFLKS